MFWLSFKGNKIDVQTEKAYLGFFQKTKADPQRSVFLT